MKTTLIKKEEVKHKWYLVDAEGEILGRLASRIAMVLMGKHRPSYTAHVDTGDFVVVINADKVKVSGNKKQTKLYKTYSGYPGGLKETTMERLMAKKPEEIISLAVKRMIPSTTLGKIMFGKLKVYAGKEHPHQAQQVVPIKECPWWKYWGQS